MSTDTNEVNSPPLKRAKVDITEGNCIPTNGQKEVCEITVPFAHL